MHIGERIKVLESIQIKSVEWADKVIFLTSFEQAKANTFIQDKSIVIPHPTTPLTFKKATRNNKKDLCLLFLGRVNQYKGVDILVEAMEAFKNDPSVKLTIAGKWSIDSKPDTEHINIIDKYLSDQELSEILFAHDVLVLPYTEASQSGIVALGIESLKPMIVSKVGGLNEQLDSDEAIFITPTVADIQLAIKECKSNPALLQKISSRLKRKKENLNGSIKTQLNQLFQNL